MAAATLCIRLLWLLIISTPFTSIANADKTVYTTVHTTIEATKTVQATPTIPSPTSYTSLDDFENAVLQVTNDYRSAHDADALVWNETLAEYARNWAEVCIWQHSDGPYGENLAFGFPNASAAVAAWGDEGEWYNYQEPTGFTEKTGHFTQLVWRDTTEVGCAAVNCGYTHSNKARRDTGEVHDHHQPRPRAMRAQGWYVVCEYTPAGNVVGRQDKYFKMNVLPRDSSKATSAAAGATTQRKMSLELRITLTLMALGTVAVGMGLYT